MSNINYKELIEQQLTGTISDGNKTILESKLASDFSLRDEMNSQSGMINGLKEFRKAELKTRLNNVPIEVGVLGTLGQSALVKVGATIGSTILFVGGMYYFSINPFNDSPQMEALTPITVIDESASKEIVAPEELPVVAAPTEPSTNGKVTSSTVSENKPLVKPSVIALVEEPVSESQVPVVEEVAPAFQKPQIVEFDSDDEFEPETIDSSNPSDASEPLEINKPIDIELKSAESLDKLQYQFYEERLYLYGNFGEVPYEIIEINSKSGKRIYLYHQDVYYTLSYPTDKVKDLEKVTNEELLKELTIFREIKALN